MPCNEIIQSNNTYDVIIPLDALERVLQKPACIQHINRSYDIYYFGRDTVPPLGFEDYTYSSIPKCFGLLDTSALEESGILQLQQNPALALYGQGVLVGFVDTGIAYENKCFRSADGSTRIAAIWDQTAAPAGEDILEEPEAGSVFHAPEGFEYGTEYTREDINRALRSENPREIVPQQDTDGHGTLLSSIACGSEDESGGFVGAVPYSELLVVKLKPAKQYLKDFFYIPQSAVVYQENDIMAAIAYLDKKAREMGRPLVICLALGTNNGSHSGGSVLSEYLDEIGALWYRCIVIATGNEANARHHFFGTSNARWNNGGIGGQADAIEINVEENMQGFYLELWGTAPELFAVSVRSPGGVLLPQAATRAGSHQEYLFVFENTRVEIDYRSVGRIRRNQLVFIRFSGASRGIWTVNVFPASGLPGSFHAWLPMTGMLPNDVFFLKSNPDVTLTIPSTASVPVTVGGYNSSNGALYQDSGRGFTTANVVKPDFNAPAVRVQGVDTRGNYTTGSGTSVAAAIATGACVQLMEWGVVRKNADPLNSVDIGNILIRGCKRDSDRIYPNTEWGYGKLDAFGAFQML